MDEKLLQHVGYYGHIYEFVCGNSRTLDEINDYLVQIGENTSTVKTHMQMLSGDTEATEDFIQYIIDYNPAINE